MSTRTSLLFSPSEPPATAPDPSGSKRLFRPYTSLDHHVTKGRYITSNDPRGYIPVYEYPLHGQWIMMDMDDGYVLWTGIWKALGHSKADIVKMVESEPELASRIRRVRGGYLKIQGTWMPYEVALRLSRRVAWHIRFDLVPLFGPTFPTTCLSPDQPGFGQIISGDTRRRRARRVPLPPQVTTNNSNWTIISPSAPRAPTNIKSRMHPTPAHRSRPVNQDHDLPKPSLSPPLSRTNAPSPAQDQSRYTPYQSSYSRARFLPSTVYGPHHYVGTGTKRDTSESTGFTIPPVQQRSSRASITLPSVSDMVGFSDSTARETVTSVLERLKSEESDAPRRSHLNYPIQTSEQLSTSTLSPFCPVPIGARSSASPEINMLPSLHVPINNQTSPSSPTFSGSSSGDVSPSTPDCMSDGPYHASRSPFIRNLDHWAAGQSQSLLDDGISTESKDHWPSAPIRSDIRLSISSDGSSPDLRARIHDPVTSRAPHRPW